VARCDLALVKELPLEKPFCDFRPERGTAVQRALTTGERIIDNPVDDYWNEVDGR
jgi:hypothetical protein